MLPTEADGGVSHSKEKNIINYHLMFKLYFKSSHSAASMENRATLFNISNNIQTQILKFQTSLPNDPSFHHRSCYITLYAFGF